VSVAAGGKLRWKILESEFSRRCDMPKYLLQGSYTIEGVKGVLKEGGSKRRAVAQEEIESVDGKLEAFYFAFGENDVVAIFDAPDNASVAAVALAVKAGGGFSGRTTVLLSPEEVDKSSKKTVKYRAPGH
jgi:uncharacterized protein with GYD domain